MNEQLHNETTETNPNLDAEKAIATGKALLERTVSFAPGIKPNSDSDQAINAGIKLIKQNQAQKSGLVPERPKDF